jgi:hypothetical protein
MLSQTEGSRAVGCCYAKSAVPVALYVVTFVALATGPLAHNLSPHTVLLIHSSPEEFTSLLSHNSIVQFAHLHSRQQQHFPDPFAQHEWQRRIPH